MSVGGRGFPCSDLSVLAKPGDQLGVDVFVAVRRKDGSYQPCACLSDCACRCIKSLVLEKRSTIWENNERGESSFGRRIRCLLVLISASIREPDVFEQVLCAGDSGCFAISTQISGLRDRVAGRVRRCRERRNISRRSRPVAIEILVCLFGRHRRLAVL